MKKIYILATSLLLSTGIIAQTNLNFEGWAAGSPGGWAHSNDTLAYLSIYGGSSSLAGANITQNVVRGTASPQEGMSYAILTSVTIDNAGGSTYPLGVYPGIVQQNFSESDRIQSIKFIYKSNLAGSDNAIARVAVSGPNYDFNSNPIGEGVYLVESNKSAWTEVTVPVQYFSNDASNEIRITFASSAGALYPSASYPNGSEGSIFEIDDIRIVYSDGSQSSDDNGDGGNGDGDGDGNVGIDESSLINNISVYPNPTKDFVNFIINKDVDANKIEIYSTTGQLMTSVEAMSTTIVNVSNFDAGLYFYRILDANNEIIRTNKIQVLK